MAYTYKVEVMPSGSVVDTVWLDAQGAADWQLIQVVPMSPITETGNGSVLCYFMKSA